MRMLLKRYATALGSHDVDASERVVIENFVVSPETAPKGLKPMGAFFGPDWQESQQSTQ